MSKLRRSLFNAVVVFVSVAISAVVFEVFAHAYWGPSISQWLTPPKRDIQTDFDVTYTVTANGTRIVCPQYACAKTKPNARSDET